MANIYDDVTRDARDDHRHNPPGSPVRPIGHRTADDGCDGDCSQPNCSARRAAHKQLEADEHWQDAGTGAYDPRDAA